MDRCVGHTPIEIGLARYRMVANNTDKNTSVKMFQPERKISFKPPGRSTGFLILS